MRQIADTDHEYMRFVNPNDNRRRLSVSNLNTGNRQCFLETAEDQFTRAWMYGETASLAVVRVDFFSSVVARLGKKGAALAMRSVAAKCLLNLRMNDLLEYLGGGEFGALFPGTKVANAVNACQRVCCELAGLSVVPADQNFKLTASVGLTSLTHADRSARAAFCRALRALRQARRGGGGQISCC